MPSPIARDRAAMRAPAASSSSTPPYATNRWCCGQATVGGERDRLFHVEIDGLRIATQRLQDEHPGEFIERDYALPRAALAGKRSVRLRFQPEPGHTAGPVFGCRILAGDH